MKRMMGSQCLKRGSIYIQTRPRHTRDVPRLCVINKTEKQHSHIAAIYNQGTRATVSIFLPSRHTHSHTLSNNLPKFKSTCLDAEKVERLVSSAPYTFLFSNLYLCYKGLGKGGAKRHRKILRDNIQGW